jgi:acetyl esterase/lipase
MGFSAGGHVASTLGTHFDAGSPKSEDPIERVSCRPDFMLLIYPLITMGPKTHAGSKQNLLGKEPSPDLVESLSNEKQVTAETPPAFLAHSKLDRVVSVEHSQMFYDALKAHSDHAIPFGKWRSGSDQLGASRPESSSGARQSRWIMPALSARDALLHAIARHADVQSRCWTCYRPPTD